MWYNCKDAQTKETGRRNCVKKKVEPKRVLKILLVGLVLIMIIGAGYICSRSVQNDLKDLLDKNIEDVASQNALTLHNELEEKENLLKNMISIMQQDGRSVAGKYMELNSLVKNYGLKRAGVCDTDGSTTATDGSYADLSERLFFKRGMEGKSSISGVLQDAMSVEKGKVTVMSMPMYGENEKITGVFGMTFDSETFNKSLESSSFDGNGFSCAINEQGQVVVAMGSDRLDLSQDFYEDVVGKAPENEQMIQQLKAGIAEGRSVSGTFYIKGTNYFHATPVSLMDGDVTWYMLTFVPHEYFQARLDHIKGDLKVMNRFIFMIVICGLLVYILITKRQHRIMHALAYTDPVTGGVNFARFLERMEGIRIRDGSYMVCMEISDFESVNIAAGKEASERLVKEIWDIVNFSMLDSEVAGHVRDEEYVVYFGACETDVLMRRLRRISEQVRALGRDLDVPGIHPHFGIYRMDAGDKIEESYTKAKLAVSFIDTVRGRQHAFYSELDHQQLMRRRELEENFDSALAGHNFEVWYQPKYSPDGKVLMGSEALIRWRDTDGSLISPGEFIPLFEQNGYIARLDEYVFRTACERQKEWLDAGYEICPVSINLSRASLYHAGLVDKYISIIEEYGLDPGCIQIEITESAINGKKKITDILEEFRFHGIRILMDDFGTGYSSLSTLNLNCFDTLKLDKSLIDYIGDKKGEILLDHVIHMGHELGLHITAEGVENDDQITYLGRLHCDDIQGFYFARPMPAVNFEKTIMHHAAR